MCKKDVSQFLRQYAKFGAVVLNFNSDRAFHGAFNGHPDHEVIMPNGFLVLIEDKFGKDRMRPEQLDYQHAILRVCQATDRVRYFVISDEDDLEVLRDYLDLIMEVPQ